MRILIADKLSSHIQPILEQLNCDIHIKPSVKDDTLLAALQDVDPKVLIVRSTKVQKRHIQAANSLSLIIRAGAGVNTIDLQTASQWGIYVANCPGKNAVAVAELVFGHLINADRRIADNVASLREGEWRKKSFTKGCMGLKSRTLGIIGLGSIGREVATRASAFAMEVIGWDPYVSAKEMALWKVKKCETLADVAQASDAITIHLPLKNETRGMIASNVFDHLKEGAIFINTSRGEVVCETSLKHAIEHKNIKVGLDVFCSEPSADGAWNQPLASMDGFYGTHHIGASTQQASEAVGDEVVRIIDTWQNTGNVPNCVNLAQQSHASHLLIVRHADAVGVLAEVLDKLRRADINVQEMENIIFQGAHAACARIQVNRPPSAPVLEDITSSPRIFATDLIALG